MFNHWEMQTREGEAHRSTAGRFAWIDSLGWGVGTLQDATFTGSWQAIQISVGDAYYSKVNHATEDSALKDNPFPRITLLLFFLCTIPEKCLKGMIASNCL